ncbi:DNA-methyltransferase [Clostridium culturomicium]|uniref:DNA-methyltransferase n=1 Tax=Clostridium culturomicium TaxID=1499683 RepID=UPI00385789FD
MNGQIKLINGDCFEVCKELEDKSIDLIFTDIPYNISKDNNFKTMKDRKGRNGIDFGEWDKNFEEERLSELVRLLKDGGSIVLFHSIEQFSTLKEIFESNGLVLKDKLIWEKTNPMPRNRDRRYISNIEIASWYTTQKGKWTFNRQNEKYEGSVLRYPSESGGGFKRFHPTQKNLEMVKKLLKIHSNPNDVILDCFLGGGTTGVAVLEVGEGRKFIGIEADSEHYLTAYNRINGYIYE